jgi:hypothetical protein
MANLELLSRRGRRAYELGRLRMAARIALILIPVLALCIGTARDARTCACLSIALLGLAIFLRWRSKGAGREVRLGLLAGAIPSLVALGLTLTPEVSRPLSLGLLVLAGLVAGGWITVRKPDERAAGRSTFMAGTIAALTAGVVALPWGTTEFFVTVAGVACGMGVAFAARSRASV